MTVVKIFPNSVYMVQSENNQFRYVKLNSHTRTTGVVVQRFLLEEYCPIIKQYVKCLWHDRPIICFSKKSEEDIETSLSETLSAIKTSPMVIMYGEDRLLYSASTTEEVGRACLK